MMLSARRHDNDNDDESVHSLSPRGANDDINNLNNNNNNNNNNNIIESSSSSIAGEGGAGAGGMTLAAHTIQTLASTIIVEGIIHTVAHWKVLAFGQAISIISAIAGGTNDILAMECGVSAPSTYNALGYTLVAIFGYMIQWRRATTNKRMNNTIGNIISNNETNNAGDDEKEERESFRENSYVGDLHLNHDDDNIEDFNYDDDDDDDIDDLTLDESITKRSSFFSIRRNQPPTPTPTTTHHHHHHHHNQSGNISAKNKKYRPATVADSNHSLPPAKWYYYFAVALVEAQAFYFIFLAFRYTSFTFVYVSDALAIPSAMIFSRLFMKRKYLWTHVVGCVICIMGIVLNTISDFNTDAKGGNGGLNDVVASLDHVKGDIFAILGAILLGLDDVLSEKILDNYGGGVSKMLTMKGMFGALISIVQLAIFERDNVHALFGNHDVGGSFASASSSSSPCELSWRMILLTTHVVSRALGVAGEMQFLYISEAALLNILLLTSDLFAAFFDVLNTGFRLTPYFCVAFLCIVVGIVLYEAGPSPAAAATVEDRILGVGGGAPVTIEFRDRGRRRNDHAGGAIAGEAASSTLMMSTEHAGNLSPSGGVMDREIT